VLVNILDNALKFSPPDSRVELRVEEHDGAVLLHVIDKGPGVPDPDVVFEPFQSAGVLGGAGLGLAIARGFAEANGGGVRAEPAKHGAHLVVELPVTARLPVHA